MKYPDFFIVGAMKSATTSVYQALAQHPQLYLSPIKEPNYFCNDIIQTRIQQQDSWNYIPTIEAYLALFNQANSTQKCGEASVSYLLSHIAAEKIYQANPQAKIIMILRNPIQRAYSHYQMACAFGIETESFSSAIRRPIIQYPYMIYQHWNLYLMAGLYYAAVKRYLDYFPAQQVSIIFYDQLQKQFQQILFNICHQLEVSPELLPNSIPFSMTAKQARFSYLNRYLYQSGIKKSLSVYLPRSWINFFKNYYYQPIHSPQISITDQHFLQQFFADDILNLSQLLNTDLTDWLRDSI
ncbi:MAG: hypothetical protein RL637_448 [Pseudomonadota bacterium]|jgi:hypothetical protein